MLSLYPTGTSLRKVTSIPWGFRLCLFLFPSYLYLERLHDSISWFSFTTTVLCQQWACLLNISVKKYTPGDLGALSFRHPHWDRLIVRVDRTVLTGLCSMPVIF